MRSKSFVGAMLLGLASMGATAVVPATLSDGIAWQKATLLREASPLLATQLKRRRGRSKSGWRGLKSGVPISAAQQKRNAIKRRNRARNKRHQKG